MTTSPTAQPGRLPTLAEALAPYLPDRDPEQAHATDGDRGGPPDGPAGYAEWLAVNGLQLVGGHLVPTAAAPLEVPGG